MKSSPAFITIAAAFPMLAPALTNAQGEMPLMAAFRSQDWPVIAQTLSLAVCRRKPIPIADLIQFPPPWYGKDLAGQWAQPVAVAAIGRRALRIFAAAGITRWQHVVERTPQQLLECSGAGLLLLSEVIGNALELTTVFLTDAGVRHGAILFSPHCGFMGSNGSQAAQILSRCDVLRTSVTER